MKTIVLVLWGIAVAVRCIALWRTYLAVFTRALWTLPVFLAVSTARSGFLIHAKIIGHGRYLAVWLNTEPVAYALDVLLALGAFWAVSCYFPKFYPWALGAIA